MRNNAAPFHRRVAKRLAQSRQRQQKYLHNRYTQIDCLMVQFERAYLEYYGEVADLRYNHGWYYLHGRKYRHVGIERMLARMLAEIQESYSPNPDEDISYE